MARVEGKIRRALICATLALAASPASAASLNILYRFTGGLDGGYPNGPLVRDAEGNLFGTTSAGGEAAGYGFGVAYRLSPAASGNWQEAVLHRFGMSPSYSPPTSGLTLDRRGALYGSAYGGGAGGYVFQLAHGPNGGYRYTTLFSFSSTSSPQGAGPLGPLLLDASGDVIGTTQYGGRSWAIDPCDCGVVYSLAPTTQSGGWPETIRYAFRGLPNSSNPEFGVTLGPDGDYYGLASEGGAGPCLDGSGVQVVGCGTLFRLRPSGTTWIETVLLSFRRVQPSGPYVFGADGALYGVDIPDVIRLVPPKDGVGALAPRGDLSVQRRGPRPAERRTGVRPRGQSLRRHVRHDPHGLVGRFRTIAANRRRRTVDGEDARHPRNRRGRNRAPGRPHPRPGRRALWNGRLLGEQPPRLHLLGDSVRPADGRNRRPDAVGKLSRPEKRGYLCVDELRFRDGKAVGLRIG